MSDTQVSARSAVEQFRDAMQERGITPPAVIETDGALHRFTTNGKVGDDAGWYVLHIGTIAAGAFGDFRTGQTVSSWRENIGRKLTPDERIVFRKQQDAIHLKRAADTEQRRAQAKDKASAMLKASSPASKTHAYLQRKGVKSYGLRLWKGLLLVPMSDDSGEVQSLQIIGDDGSKKFLKGGKFQGCYFIIGSLPNANRVLICEGYATAATLHEATGYPVVVAFSAGNLPAVSTFIRSQCPDTPITVCADDDILVTGNPGVTKAAEAAAIVDGDYLLPDFGDDRPDEATDFNDMAACLGLLAVTRFLSEKLGEQQKAFLQTPRGTSQHQGDRSSLRRLASANAPT